MTPREQRLLLGFFAVLLIVGSVIGFDFYRKYKAELKEQKWALELQLVEYETLMEEDELWNSRGNWLSANQPGFTTRQAIDNHIFTTVKSPPAKVSVSNLKLIEGKQTDHWIQAGVQLLAKGTLKDVFGWLYELQSPENFYVIENVKIIPDKKELDVIQCQFDLVRWYAPKP